MFRTKSKLESHKHVCESKKLCGVVPSQDTILGLNYKTASIIYADLESLIKRVDEYKNNFSGGTFSVFDMDIWWCRKQRSCIQSKKLRGKNFESLGEHA